MIMRQDIHPDQPLAVDAIERNIIRKLLTPGEKMDERISVAEVKLRGSARRLNRSALVRECAAIRLSS